jgi:hypothetical protein
MMNTPTKRKIGGKFWGKEQGETRKADQGFETTTSAADLPRFIYPPSAGPGPGLGNEFVAFLSLYFTGPYHNCSYSAQ